MEKAIQTNKAKIAKQIDEIWNYAQNMAAQDKLDREPPTHTVSSESVGSAVQKLNEVFAGKDNIDKKAKVNFSYINRNFPQNIKKYEDKEALLGDRNSCSTTDADATFMRMKEDHMKNGQLKAGFNIQISTSKQFSLNYTLHSNPTDTLTLSAHIAQDEKSFGKAPGNLQLMPVMDPRKITHY